MSLGDAAAADFKLQVVSNALLAQGVRPLLPTLWLSNEGDGLGYRNRMRVQVNRHHSERGGLERASIGVVPGVADCPVATQSVRVLLRALSKVVAESAALPPYFGDVVDHVEVRGSDSDGRAMIVLHLRQEEGGGEEREEGEEGEAIGALCLGPERLRSIKESLEDTILGEMRRGSERTPAPCFDVVEVCPSSGVRTITGGTDGDSGAAIPPRMQRFRVLEEEGTYTLVPATSFVQVNRNMNRSLVNLVCDLVAESLLAAPTLPQTVLDLYCGCGNYSLPVLKRNSGAQSHGVEWSQDAIGAAKLAAQLQGFESRATFEAGSVPTVAARLAELGQQYSVVVCNPPRAGLKAAAAASIGQLAQNAIVIVACNPSTLAIDLRALLSTPSDGEWVLQRVWALNMFPHTKHVECCAWLTRGGGGWQAG